ncbi:hypothetical protein OSTOST_09165 [Ostertagia ostertagi]
MVKHAVAGNVFPDNRCTYVGASLLYAIVSLILNVRLMIELRKLLKNEPFWKTFTTRKGHGALHYACFFVHYVDVHSANLERDCHFR